MHPIIYDVSVSLDGFISGPSGDVSKFAHEGPVVEDYLARMAEYKTAIMGRCTYEFGYKYGLEPGQNPYPTMETTVFSQTLRCPDESRVSVARSTTADAIEQLQQTSTGLIYLCGGGKFAGWMLERRLIDRVILKRAPCVLGQGVSLFGLVGNGPSLSRVATKSYDNGYLLEEYSLPRK